MLRSANIQLSTFPGQTSCHKFPKLNTDAQIQNKMYSSWLVDFMPL